MFRAVLRLVVAVAAASCVWLVAIPAAWASTLAPQCDHRGAITFAPPPQLQPPEQSIDMTDDESSCVEKALRSEGLRQGNSPPPSPTSTEPVAPAAAPAVAEAALAYVLPRHDAHELLPTGVRSSLERPPRV